ncbi:MAG: hypothetical protein Q7S19_00450 [bacterium]|nr:hypothetical protein [bacterium]
MGSRGPGKFIGICKNTDNKVAAVEIMQGRKLTVVREFIAHLKLIQFDVGARVARKRLLNGVALEGKIIEVGSIYEVSVLWDGSLRPVWLETSELILIANEVASQPQKRLAHL